MTGLFKKMFRRSTSGPDKGNSTQAEKSHQQVQRFTFPPEIPEEIRDAYDQACYLLQRSPKASGALSRYCLQQIARDYWQLSNSERGTLSAEFSLLSDRVLAETQASINYIRKFGSIESQLSNDRDLMVDTTVDEAKMLLALVQLLVQEWYLDRQKRQNRCNTIKMMIDEATSKQKVRLENDCSSAPEKKQCPDPQNVPHPVSLKPTDASPKDVQEKIPSTGD